MFGRHKEHKRKRSTNLPFVIFRLLLSLTIFAVLAGGVYSAFKQFSGVDPVSADPKAIVSNFISDEAEFSGKMMDLVLSFLSLNIQNNSVNTYEEETKPIQKTEPVASKPKLKTLDFKFALVSDSHSDNDSLKKALAKAKVLDAKFIIGLGDYTEVGTEDELNKAKKQFDEAGIRYFVTVGDHDLWDSRDKGKNPPENFTKIFGPPFQSFEYQNVKLIIIYNSDNYKGLGDNQKNWIKSELATKDKLIFVFTHEPLYHPSSDRFMGKVTPSLKTEARDLIREFKSAGVKEVFSGDIHFFTRYSDPEGLPMTTVGAVTRERNTQTPRFAVVSVYTDGSFEVEDIEIQ